MDLSEFQEIKEIVESSQRELDKASGGLAQLLKELKEKFDCVNIKEAKKKYEELNQELEDFKVEYIKALKRMKKKYPQLFGE